jgi:hypothetical protein
MVSDVICVIKNSPDISKNNRRLPAMATVLVTAPELETEMATATATVLRQIEAAV